MILTNIDFPALIVTATVWAYWLNVGYMAVRARRRSRDLAGLVPQQALERLMWLLWVPMVIAWMVLPLLAQTRPHSVFAVPAFARELAGYEAFRWVAAIVAVLCLHFTRRCWRRMGSDWRMAISEEQKSPLITDGLFARVRHPIYALSILFVVCTSIVIPTVPMLAVALLNIGLLTLKAGNEERHLLKVHGDAYAAYLRQTGRFVPRWSAPVA